MTKWLSENLSSGCRLLLAVHAMLLMSALVDTQLIRAQAPQTNETVPVSFEVASIKPTAPDPTRSGISTAPAGRFTISAMSVATLPRFAYRAKVTTSGQPG